MNDVVFDLLNKKDYIIKNYIINISKELKLTLNDTLLLIYLSNQSIPNLNLEDISKNMYMTNEEIYESFSKLKTLNLISVEVIKESNGTINEVIKLDSLLKMITCDVTSKGKEENKSNLYDKFESEFGRLLSPMEYEIINDWIKQGFKEELILEALKEAIYNNAKSFRYIQAILNAWKEKGIRNASDIVKSERHESNDEVKELFDYDWLNE